MKCPACNIDLKMSERQGVEVDYCPQCRGVWLDRGELDKIIEKASPGNQRDNFVQEGRDVRDYRDDDDDDDNRFGRRDGRRKREGFLGDLFDF